MYIGDSSAASTSDQSILDARIREFIEMEDLDIISDLRVHNGTRSSCYDIFWDHCNQFLNDVGIAVDDRRHGQVTHLARAISIRDFTAQVKAKCPDGTPIPSEEWVRLQFWPKTHKAKASLQHTGRFTLKFMVQQRQWRHSHPDTHYAAACFRYMRVCINSSIPMLICMPRRQTQDYNWRTWISCGISRKREKSLCP